MLAAPTIAIARTVPVLLRLQRPAIMPAAATLRIILLRPNVRPALIVPADCKLIVIAAITAMPPARLSLPARVLAQLIIIARPGALARLRMLVRPDIPAHPVLALRVIA